MTSFLIDGRTLILRYTFQPGAELLDVLFVPEMRERLVCPWLSVAELIAELNRQQRNQRMTATMFEGAVFHLRDQILQPATVGKPGADAALIEGALALLETHPLKAVDGIILKLAVDAAAFHRPSGDGLVLVTTDRGLLRAARREGLPVFDPQHQNAADLDALIRT